MRYILLDRVKYLEANKKVIAIKNVTLTEDVFADHFHGQPIMPGALLMECMAHAGTVLLEVSSGYAKKALLVMVDQMKFRLLVRPGDQLWITMDVLSANEEAARLEARIEVEGRLVANGRMTFGLKDVEAGFQDYKRFAFDLLYKVWLEGAELVGVQANGEAS